MVQEAASGEGRRERRPEEPADGFGLAAAAGRPNAAAVVLTCQSGFEKLLARELETAGVVAREVKAGWVASDDEPAAAELREQPGAAADLCFAHAALLDAAAVDGKSVNALAAAVAERFLASARGERFETLWPLLVSVAPGLDGLGRRAASVEAAARELLQRKMARVARLATGTAPRTGRARGLFVFFADFDRAFVAREAWFGGQRRMADDPAAPSRSFLKVEEAFGILGREPAAGETVADLGAAPGGWSFSAARRGARVVAVDNGPLKGGALGHAQIEHRREDAFKFRPEAGAAFDWMFCDLVEEPHHVWRTLVGRWIEERWCRRFVVNLKFGRADAIALLAEVRAGPGLRCARLLVRHLFHDREEFTLMGEAG